MTASPGRPCARAASVGGAAALVGVLTALVFLPALRNGFVNWDDAENIVTNVRFRGLGPANLGWMFTTFHMGPYQPLTWLTLGLDHAVWGMNPLGYHLTNVLLHAFSAAALLVLTLRLVRHALPSAPAEAALDPWWIRGAALGALAWAVHPLRVESVAWVTERRDVLSGLFLLLALLAYVQRPAGPRPLAVALTALALLAKASTMVLPPFLVVLDVYPLRRLGRDAGWTSPAARRVLYEKLPFVALAAAAAVVAVVAQRRAGTLVALADLPLGARLGIAMYQGGFYVWKTLLPVGLQPMYEVPPGMGPLHPLALAGAATVLALATVAWALRHRWPVLAAATAVYLIGFAPTNGLVQGGAKVAADRYTYLAALGGAPLVAAAVARPAAWRTLRATLAGAVVLGLAIASIRQVGFWRDSVTLWERALAVAPGSVVGHELLGRAYFENDRGDDAIRLFDDWLRAEPGNARAWTEYGVMLGSAGEDARARPVLEQALALDPGDAPAYYARGLIRDRGGDPDGALADYDAALRLEPGLALAYHSRGLNRRKRGDTAGALADFARALTFDEVRSAPNVFAAYASYGVLLAQQGQVDAGLEALDTAVALAPEENRAGIEELRAQVAAQRGAR